MQQADTGTKMVHGQEHPQHDYFKGISAGRSQNYRGLGQGKPEGKWGAELFSM